MSSKTLSILMLAQGLLTGGVCAHADWLEPRPLGREIPAPDLSLESPEVLPSGPAISEPTGDLTLREVLSLALLQSPELKAFAFEVRAREAAVLQAGLLPNPQLGVVAENFGNNALQGFDSTAITLQLSQLIELGGKRAARTEATQLARDLAGWDYERERIKVVAETHKAYVEVLSAQVRAALTEQVVDLAEEVAAAVAKRVTAGKVSPVEETKARVATASVRIELTRAERELEAARKRLAATWGSTAPRFKRALGVLEAVLPIPSLEQLMERLRRNPELARWATEIAERQAVIGLEETRAIPDLTASFGVRRFDEPADDALVVGISLPLPVFNRNQGAILEAQRRLTKAEEERRATEVRVATALSSAYQTLAGAHAEIIALKAQVLPGAQSAFEAATKGYRQGKFGLLDVLDAQRTLFGTKAQYLRALTDYHQSVAQVEGLIGERLEAVQTQKESR
jgi:cobalt-zinc-cadmium efflux system outer membrane protein